MRFPTTIEFLGFGEEEVNRATLGKMRDIILSSVRNPACISVARAIIRFVPEKDYLEEAKAIYNWVRKHSKYVRDPHGLETLTTPPTALEIIRAGGLFEGDCDDLTMLTATLMKCIGFPVALIATSYASNKKLSHVYCLIQFKGKWIPVEPIKKDVELGWEAPNKTARLTMKV